MRRVTLAEGEYYHIYNRGVDKRDLFCDSQDLSRFFKTLHLFNTEDVVGSLYELERLGDQVTKTQDRENQKQLVEIVCYCLNPNHYHLLLKQCVPDGISKYMKRIAGGYSYYFNLKYKRSGTLFQGPFKAVHVDDNRYLLHLSAYINLNDRVHHFGDQVTKILTQSSWDEYVSPNHQTQKICSSGIILEQFTSLEKYMNFAMKSLEQIKKRKDELRSLEFG